MNEPRPPTEDHLSPEAIAEVEAELPAFPWGDVTNGGVSGGLTKRELFAAMAMQGMCANSVPGNHHIPSNLAKEAVWQADELLKELAK